MTQRKKPELLAPAGSLDKLKTALDYGADAVYFGGEAYSLRTAAENFTPEEMAEGISYAHARGKKAYVAANIFLRNADIAPMREYIAQVAALGADAVIVSDIGAMRLAREVAPDLPVHVSTQANTLNYMSAQAYREMGAQRVILARELSIAEIREMREQTDGLELELFVHGAMCVSYSGRCLLSNYMAGRDSNRGACAHPCRWRYALVEEKRPGEYFPVYEDERGSFVLNSKDLCLIRRIPELIQAGVDSLKIEGRVKSAFYVATVVKAYREAIDAYFADPDGYAFDPSTLAELEKVSHRGYTEAFFDGAISEDAQVYTTGSYIRTYDLVAMVTEFDAASGMAVLSQRNKFSCGEEIEVIQPGQPFFTQVVRDMRNVDGEPIESAPHAEMTVRLKLDRPAVPGAMVRRRRVDV